MPAARRNRVSKRGSQQGRGRGQSLKLVVKSPVSNVSTSKTKQPTVEEGSETELKTQDLDAVDRQLVPTVEAPILPTSSLLLSLIWRSPITLNSSLLESLPQSPPQISPASSLSPISVDARPEFVLEWHSFFNKIPLVSISDVVKANGEGFLFYFIIRKDTQKASKLADKRGLEPQLIKRMATISSNHHQKVDLISMEVDEFDDWAKVLWVITNWLEKDKKKGVKVKMVSQFSGFKVEKETQNTIFDMAEKEDEKDDIYKAFPPPKHTKKIVTNKQLEIIALRQKTKNKDGDSHLEFLHMWKCQKKFYKNDQYYCYPIDGQHIPIQVEELKR
ncbi:MAG: hypothetical protein M1837_000855 [Sclerophora amabilis]|nr:MAG: hypothetical protein M1837_000855 [Sclerophora amabilis]